MTTPDLSDDAALPVLPDERVTDPDPDLSQNRSDEVGGPGLETTDGSFQIIIPTAGGSEEETLAAQEAFQKATGFKVHLLPDGNMSVFADETSARDILSSSPFKIYDTSGNQITSADFGGLGAPVDGVMQGGDLVKVQRPDGSSYFALRYQVQGIEHLYSFETEAAAEKALGSLAGATILNEDTVDDGDTWLLGDAASMVGQEGSYAVFFDGLMTEAALEAGIQNPGMLGRYASDPAIMKILAEAAAGEWGVDRIQAAVRTTEFYLEVLYPGIESILETGIGNPEVAWKRYNDSVEDTLTSLGYTRDADGSYRSKIGEMLEKGIKDEVFVESGALFIRAEQSAQFKGILDQWVLDATGKSVTFDEWFDVLAGTTSPELAQIVENATTQFQAERHNLGLSPTDIARITSLTEFSEQEVGQLFSSAEQQLLALGDVGLARYSLSQQKLVDSFLDIGPSAAETRKLATKTIRELGLADDEKAQFFTGFTQRGAPQKVGLLAGAPEAG